MDRRHMMLNGVKRYALSASAGMGCTLTMNRISSPKKHAPTGAVVSGDWVYSGDVITISAAADTGYNTPSITVNGVSHTSGQSVTVSSDLTVLSATSVRTFTLSLSQGANSTINVNRTSSPIGGGSTGNIPDGTTLYYGDTLTITFAAATDYQLVTHTVNGSSFESGESHTVAGNVNVVSTSTPETMEISVGCYYSTGEGTVPCGKGTFDVPKNTAFSEFLPVTAKNDATKNIYASGGYVYCQFKYTGATQQAVVQYRNTQITTGAYPVSGRTYQATT